MPNLITPFQLKFREAVRALRELLGEQSILRREHARILEEIRASTPDSPALHGYKVYSQCDEDGIIAHIFSRIGEGNRVFVEIGCSDGLENNTHALLLRGWRGAWIDADGGKVASIRSLLPQNNRLSLYERFVTRQNAAQLVADAIGGLASNGVDFLSIDIDGDDLGVAENILGSFQPRLVCVEYNPKFHPPLCVSVHPEREGGWSGDDYYGASLGALESRLAGFGYRLVACNATGVNAFFVRSDAAGQFTAYSIEQLYRPAALHLRHLSSGHRPSLKFLVDALRQDTDTKST